MFNDITNSVYPFDNRLMMHYDLISDIKEK